SRSPSIEAAAVAAGGRAQAPSTSPARTTGSNRSMVPIRFGKRAILPHCMRATDRAAGSVAIGRKLCRQREAVDEPPRQVAVALQPQPPPGFRGLQRTLAVDQADERDGIGLEGDVGSRGFAALDREAV